MRIRAFSKNIEFHELEECNLKNCNVVIDGQNYFYNLYEYSGLPFQFGCESDKYAEFLRDHLSMFKNANVKCYIIFKGGDENDSDRSKNQGSTWSSSYEVSGPQNNIVLPVFMKTVYKEVLDEMAIDYVVCQFESKKQCIALAQKLKCPIISFDIEFGFSGVPYIPYEPSLTFNSPTASIQCGVFKLQNFMRKYGISKDKLALFIVLTDENIFPEQFFQYFFDDEGIPNLSPFKRNRELIKWLSRNTVQRLINKTSQLLSPEDKQKFEEGQSKMLDLIDKNETPGEPVKYLMNGQSVSFEENDPCWFEKGVIANKIAIPYVNLYYTNAFYGSWSIEDLEADDALFLSIDIVKYAFNLLTNYQKDNNIMIFHNNKWETQNVSLTNSPSVQKPPFEAQISPFENGWDGLKSLKLFDYFINNSLPDANLIYLTNLPKGARLLMLTLVYFSRRKAVDTTLEVYSVLLSYVMLGVVFQKLSDNDVSTIPDSEINGSKGLVDLKDCQKALTILEPFFKLSRYELSEIFNRKLIHPLVEFQHCLQQMNNLNTLCGQCSFEPTVYNKTYNGTFVYKIYYSIQNKSAKKGLRTIKQMLTPAPTVLDFFMNLVKVYRQIMS